jgi:CRP/FNR family transcriptional regulator, cyclic AMP receptor protein
MQIVEFGAGEIIIREGDEGKAAFFIINGAVEIIVGEGARAKVVGALNKGEVFGEMCLIEPGPRSATVRATMDTQCLATSYEEFIVAIEQEPAHAIQFMKTLVRRLRQMNELITLLEPRRRGLREILQSSLGPAKLDPEIVTLSWTMLW